MVPFQNFFDNYRSIKNMKAFSNNISNDAIKIPTDEILLTLRYSKMTLIISSLVLLVNVLISGLFGYIILENLEHYKNIIEISETVKALR